MTVPGDSGGSASSALTLSALAMSEMFARWPLDLIEQLARSARLRRYERGTHVTTGYGSGRQVLLVVSGFLEVSQSDADGRRFLLGIVGAGQVSGLIRLFGDPPVEYGYLVRERAVVIHLPCEDLVLALNREPLLWRSVTKGVLERHVTVLGSLLDQVVVGSVDQRIAATLQRLAGLFGVKVAGGVRLSLRLSQDDLADMLCVSRQTVNKELKHLEEAGVIATTYNTVTIVDRSALQDIIDSRS